MSVLAQKLTWCEDCTYTVLQICNAECTGVICFREAVEDGAAHLLKVLPNHDDECRKGRRILRKMQHVSAKMLKIEDC